MPETRHPAFDELRSANRARRQQAAAELERLGTQEALVALVLANFRGEIDHPLTDKLVRDLESPDAEVRRTAVDFFSAYMWNDPTVVKAATPGVIKALYDPDREVQISAAFALGVFGGLEAVNGLLGALNAALDSGMKVVILKALGTTQWQSLVPALSEFRDSTPSPCVKVAAQKALDRIRGPKF